MSGFSVVDHGNTNARPFDSRAEAEDKAKGIKQMVSNPSDIEVVQGSYETYDDYEANHEPETEDVDAEVIDMTDKETPPDPGTPAAQQADPRDGTPVEPSQPDVVESENPELDPSVLAQDPIEWLESQNSAFVNYIKGTPAISKQGFRYIQQQFGITTECEVVHTFDDPTGVVVWAKAERPDGQTAEAHGEGYMFESGVDDNEFVRYADTRAKNRALSDLTSAGALAVSELTNDT